MNKVSGPDVVAAWGAVNGLLVAILIGYGENVFAIALYAASVALIELVAIATWWVQRTRMPWAARSPAPRPSRAAALAAITAGFVGAGIVWSWWVALPGAYPLAALLFEGTAFPESHS